MKKKLTIFTDGGSRGNPGPAAIGYVVKDETGNVLIETGKAIGETTNNVAEYTAVIEALSWVKINLVNSISSINFYLDSQLVVHQLNGLYKIKNAKLRELIIEVRKLEQAVGGNISYQHIPREENTRADFLVQEFSTQ